MFGKKSTVSTDWVENVRVLDANTVAVVVRTPTGLACHRVPRKPLFGDMESLQDRINKQLATMLTSKDGK